MFCLELERHYKLVVNLFFGRPRHHLLLTERRVIEAVCPAHDRMRAVRHLQHETVAFYFHHAVIHEAPLLSLAFRRREYFGMSGGTAASGSSPIAK